MQCAVKMRPQIEALLQIGASARRSALSKAFERSPSRYQPCVCSQELRDSKATFSTSDYRARVNGGQTPRRAASPSVGHGSSPLLPPRRSISSSSDRPYSLSSTVIRSGKRTYHNLAKSVAEELRLPIFHAKAEQVSLLESPSDFYQALKAGIKNAKRSICIASLYIGKGEVELVSSQE